MEPCEPHGGQGIIKMFQIDMFTWWPPQESHLPSCCTLVIVMSFSRAALLFLIFRLW